ncbi:hypothetical protein GDO86_019138 [Hymenochirus boettgeri]|uniref:Alpha-1,3-mannosyl-glycoprotein 4-beta-N-acetylglucosaminyltransferase C n=1 Tax=Hymenochirus boettgeri TaxID=247094 RepID=A0A8T2IDN2_9PIPI|nr:hypothetical protein GDO86_019138 [Hymenochirus boettgeri]
MRIWHFAQISFGFTFLVCVLLTLKRTSPDNDCLESPESLQKKDVSQEIEETYQYYSQNFSVKHDTLGHLWVPYNYLIGSPPASRRFMTIGISSVHREKQDYLMETIKSIFSHLSEEELEEVILVIYLANHEEHLNLKTAKEIEGQFSADILVGRLIVISTSPKNYPPLDGLKRNYNDPPERVKFRSKQNVDYAFLVNFCANISYYYLMLEDDVSCTQNFLTAIRKSLDQQLSQWTTITFSSLGYIGKLYHSADLPQLARFLLLFYDEMPCDWLLEHFHRSKAQPEMIRIKPSLFQHMGSFSSFQSRQNKLKDNEFVEVIEHFGDSPPALCYTNMNVYMEFVAENLCFPGPNFFWGKDIDESSNFTMVFQNTINIGKIQIITGSTDHPGDTLKSGYVELGRQKFQDNDKTSCKSFSKIGDFQNGIFSVDNLNITTAGEKIDCLKIQVSASQDHWLLIKKIGIWTQK